MENPNFWANLPANVRYSRELSSLEKLLYAEITALSNLNGECYASNAYFGRLFNKGAIWVSKCISNLKKQGFIELSYINGFDRKIVPIYDIYGGVVEKDKGGCLKMQGGVVEKDNNNNTLTESNNNNNNKQKNINNNENLSKLSIGDQNMTYEEAKTLILSHKTQLQKKFFYKIGDDETFDACFLDYWCFCENKGNYPTEFTLLRRFERYLKPSFEKPEDIKNMIVAYRKRQNSVVIDENIINLKEEEKRKNADIEKAFFMNLASERREPYIQKAKEEMFKLTRGFSVPNANTWDLMVLNKAIKLYIEDKKKIL